MEKTLEQVLHGQGDNYPLPVMWMCEVFGACGWAEGTPLMTRLANFLLVRGINHFVPHGFTNFFPDPDCPPHFYAQGNNPKFAGVSYLIRYTNHVVHLLYGAKK